MSPGIRQMFPGIRQMSPGIRQMFPGIRQMSPGIRQCQRRNACNGAEIADKLRKPRTFKFADLLMFVQRG